MWYGHDHEYGLREWLVVNDGHRKGKSSCHSWMAVMVRVEGGSGPLVPQVVLEGGF
jgi:hypothetical protein